jgi:hypothetical protein
MRGYGSARMERAAPRVSTGGLGAGYGLQATIAGNLIVGHAPRTIPPMTPPTPSKVIADAVRVCVRRTEPRTIDVVARSTKGLSAVAIRAILRITVPEIGPGVTGRKYGSGGERECDHGENRCGESTHLLPSCRPAGALLFLARGEFAARARVLYLFIRAQGSGQDAKRTVRDGLVKTRQQVRRPMGGWLSSGESSVPTLRTNSVERTRLAVSGARRSASETAVRPRFCVWSGQSEAKDGRLRNYPVYKPRSVKEDGDRAAVLLRTRLTESRARPRYEHRPQPAGGGRSSSEAPWE